jgi:BirA family transcriptional regulator, biotin operon repressor / biotin---[acetyl-CoA-carboxylase] ligase
MVIWTARMTQSALLARLADGAMHSGESLAADLNVSRTAVWKSVERLRALSIPVLAVPRQGYRLAQPIELLDAKRVRSELNAAQRRRLRHLEVHFEVDSTNSRLLEAEPLPKGMSDVCMAEMQSHGRGRRGRRWITPLGSGLALSLSWEFRDQPKGLSALSLAVGVAVIRALERAGGVGALLKWPNDLWYQDRKLGGVLIEMRAEAGGPAFVVIGVGLNVHLDAEAQRKIEATGVKVASIQDACVAPPSRNKIAGAIVDEVLGMLELFENDGFARFANSWAALDALRDRSACVLVGHDAVVGIARGIDADGAMLLESAGTIRRFVAGEVSLRMSDPP